jgi:hypothetical protein
MLPNFLSNAHNGRQPPVSFSTYAAGNRYPVRGERLPFSPIFLAYISAEEDVSAGHLQLCLYGLEVYRIEFGRKLNYINYAMLDVVVF